jgi:hypothetical protein
MAKQALLDPGDGLIAFAKALHTLAERLADSHQEGGAGAAPVIKEGIVAFVRVPDATKGQGSDTVECVFQRWAWHAVWLQIRTAVSNDSNR